jgi:hypothetical protein
MLTKPPRVQGPVPETMTTAGKGPAPKPTGFSRLPARKVPGIGLEPDFLAGRRSRDRRSGAAQDQDRKRHCRTTQSQEHAEPLERTKRESPHASCKAGPPSPAMSLAESPRDAERRSLDPLRQVGPRCRAAEAAVVDDPALPE